jgi:hypothetical protein
MRHEERIANLERGLARLEGIVERLAGSMNAEHAAMKESRQEERAAIRELGDKMEKSVAELAGQIKVLADKSANIDTVVLSKQSQALGALSFARWSITTALTVAALVIAYQAGVANNSSPEPQQVQGAR